MATDAQLANDLTYGDVTGGHGADAEPLSLADRLELMDGGPRAETRRTQGVLARTIDRDVLPRLVLAHRAAISAGAPTA